MEDEYVSLRCHLALALFCHLGGEWGGWQLQGKSGDDGVFWTERFWPVYQTWHSFSQVSKGVSAVASNVKSLLHR